MSSPKQPSSRKRMESDVMKLLMSNHDVSLIDDCIDKFFVTFKGPQDSPYEGGHWRVRVELPPQYPYKSPSIGFVNKIFHPNIDEVSGSVCLDVINQTWSPMYELINVFEVFLPQLLLYPNAADPLNGEAASVYVNNKPEFVKMVKAKVQQYAQLDQLLALGASGDGHEEKREKRGSSDSNPHTNGKEGPAIAGNANGNGKTNGKSQHDDDDDDDDDDDESDLDVMDSDDEDAADKSLTL